MSVCLLLISDGRDELRDRTLASVDEHLPPSDALIEIDDRDHRLGFAGAIAEGWRAAIGRGAKYVFHLEADFVFKRPVELDAMRELLELRPELAQVALKRQAWNDREKAAGGLVEADADDFTERAELSGGRVHVWTEHQRFFTTNPSLYRTELCHRGWPQRRNSEGNFTLDLLRDKPDTRFAFWGSKFDTPAVEHIGVERAGHGY